MGVHDKVLAAQELQEPLGEEPRAGLSCFLMAPLHTLLSPSLGKCVLHRAKPATQAKGGVWGEKERNSTGKSKIREGGGEGGAPGTKCRSAEAHGQPMGEQMATAALLEHILS